MSYVRQATVRESIGLERTERTVELQVGRCVYVRLACLMVDAVAGASKLRLEEQARDHFSTCCGELSSRRGANGRMDDVGVMYKEVVVVQIEVLGSMDRNVEMWGVKKCGTVVCADLSGHEIENACR